ncbi:MAG TPA: ATP-binding protein, partial [Acidimicrobiales bacterium]|nr:ATP-binding protein [Acidimicrobiales bacterium]
MSGRQSSRVGHTATRERVREVLAAARSGRSGVLVLRGEPGIGKTTVLRQAVEEATGMTLLMARGAASEVGTPLCALADVLRPIRPAWEQLDAPWRDLLAGATALDDAPQGTGRRRALHTATLLGLAAAAEEAPLLVVVDDAHWLDEASASALLFVLRRLEAEAVAVLVAHRAGEPVFTEGAGFDESDLGPLAAGEIGEILSAHGLEVNARATARVAEATGGNPLAAIECARLLDEAQRRGASPLPDPLPIGRAIDREFARQIRELPAGAALALLVLAADQEARLAEALQALALLGLGLEDLVPAERAALVDLGGERPAWRHPLVRLAAYHVAGADDRRRAHGALAEVVLDPYRRAGHLGAAVVGVDEAAAGALEAAAGSARKLDLPEVAIGLLRRAAELSGGLPAVSARRTASVARSTAR